VSGATSWNSELPSGRNPFWIKDEALADLGLHVGDMVSVDTRREPVDGDLVLAEYETEQEADRVARRYVVDPSSPEVRLEATTSAFPTLHLAPDQVILLGVICTRVRLEQGPGDTTRVVEEPL
jgi:SOS-response transcriptional repressor LexA